MFLTRFPAWQKVFALIIVLLVAYGCSSQSGTVETESLHEDNFQTKQISIADAVTQVEQYSPVNASPLLAQLRDQLVLDLQALDADKIVSTPPRGSDNSVTDLSITNSTAQLNWTYVNTGDYDQNSEVNVADLTPVAIFFGSTPADANWINAIVADGDNNLEVNLADISQIAINYMNSLTDYNIYTSSDLADVPVLPGDPNGAGATLAESISFDDADIPPGFKTFTQVLSAPVDLNWYWVRPSDSVELGDASNSVQFEEPAVLNIPPTAAVSADPSTGDTPLIVNFDATTSTDSDGTIVLYEWDWDGAVGGLAWESTGATGTAQHTYDAEGTYAAVVRVTDNLGATDTDSVSIVVNEVVIEGFSVSGRSFNAEFMGVPIPDIEIHIESTTVGLPYTDTVVTGADGSFVFLDVPSEREYILYGDDPAYNWPDPSPVALLVGDIEWQFVNANYKY